MNYILNGIIGLAVGDALGVPVEFSKRSELNKNKVTDMISFGTHDQIKGTWSDDTSMTLCLLNSIIKENEINYHDIMNNFSQWIKKGAFTAHGKVFDYGFTTYDAIKRFNTGTEALECGGIYEDNNGNGSLMRVLPVAFYIYKTTNKMDKNSFELVENISSLTHATRTCFIACNIYINIALNLLNGDNLITGVNNAINNVLDYYKKDLGKFYRLSKLTEFIKLPESEIFSTGYVLHTLEASIWCLFNSNNYADTILRAVNLGDDTDTVGAITGGLAGIYYGIDSIPSTWKKNLIKYNYIENMCNDFNSINFNKKA